MRDDRDTGGRQEEIVERVNGIGGVLFWARDPAGGGRWYPEHVGVAMPPASYGMSSWRPEAGPTVLAPMPVGAEHVGGPAQAWAVNFRVADLDAMVRQ